MDPLDPGALRRPRITLAAGLVLLLALAAPAIGMRLGMPGARVVDEGRSSRDGYEMVVSAFRPGSCRPVFITVAAADSQAVLDVAAADPGAAAASIVARPAESGRTVVRVIPTTAVDSAETTELVSRLRADVAEVAPVPLPAAGRPEPRLTDVPHGPGAARHRRHHGGGVPAPPSCSAA